MKKVLLSSLVALALLSGASYANETNAQKSKAVSAKAISHAKLEAQNSAVKVVKEAVESVKLTQEVLFAINANKKDEAIKKLEKAIGKLEVLMSNPKTPALIPLSSSVVVSEFAGSVRDAENAIISSIALLQNRRVQDARVIVQTLKDEIDFVTLNLPLASYPSALKLAAKYLHDNKLNSAREVLASALNTFVEVDVVTPIGILEAQDLIVAASKVAKSDKKLALSHLEAAKMALKRSEVLGYTSTSDTTYKMLKDEIIKIEKEIKGKNEAEKLFEDLINKIKEFKDKAIKSITH